MKLPCALVRDLLPLYHDQVCAPESCDAVEEHLKDCEACQGVYHALGDAPGEGAPACSLEAAALRQVKKKDAAKVCFYCGVRAAAVRGRRRGAGHVDEYGYGGHTGGEY